VGKPESQAGRPPSACSACTTFARAVVPPQNLDKTHWYPWFADDSFLKPLWNCAKVCTIFVMLFTWKPNSAVLQIRNPTTLGGFPSELFKVAQ